MLEHDALVRKRIQLRRQTKLLAEKAHAVCSDGIQRDEDNVGLVCGCRGERGQQNKEAKDASAPHKKKRSLHCSRLLFSGPKPGAADQKMTFAPICAARAPPEERNALPEEISGVVE